MIYLPKKHQINEPLNPPTFAVAATADVLIGMAKQKNDVKPLACCRYDAHNVFLLWHKFFVYTI
jgi:hypothetical protein